MDTTGLVAAVDGLSSKANTAPAEVFRAFNDLFRRNSREINENCLRILEKFRPETRVGRILRIRLIDRCQVHAEVLKLLQCGDSLETNQGLKCRWFFAKLEESEKFVNEVLPSMSLSIRLKVINRYAAHLVDTSMGEGLYVGLKSRYGTRDAILALPACGESFIRDELPNLTGTTLRPNMVLALMKKYPSLGTEYLTYLVNMQLPHNIQTQGRYQYHSYTSSFHKLSQTDLAAFISMYQEHSDCIPPLHLGRRVFKRCIKLHLDHLLMNYDKFGSFFEGKLQSQRLSLNQLKNVVRCMFPANLTDFFEIRHWDRLVQNLKDCKNPVQSSLLVEEFRSKYGKDPYNYLSMFGDYWMDIIPVEWRIAKVKMRLDGVENPREEAEFVAYLPVDQAMPRLKSLIESHSDSEVRSSIGRHMIRTLMHNHDPKGLKELFTYFNKRFRNETKQFKDCLLSELIALIDVKKFLLQLDEDDWAPIEEFIDIMRLNNEIDMAFWSIQQLFEVQIQCYLLKGVGIESYLRKYLDFTFSHRHYDYLCILEISQKTPFVRTFVGLFVEEIKKIHWDSASDKLSAIERVLRVASGLKDENGPIIMPEEIIVEIENFLEDPKLQKDINLESVLIHSRKMGLEDRLFKAAFPACANGSVLTRLLRTDPALVRDNLDSVLVKTSKESFRRYRLFYAKCRLYESYGIPQKLAEVCQRGLGVVNDTEEAAGLPKTSLPHVVQVMSLVLGPSEYANAISKYVPIETTIKDNSQEAADMFALQKAVCQSFVNVSNPLTMLPTLQRFTVGDYLKIAVGAMTGVCSRVAENEALPVLEKWTNCPVSLRKHVLRLIYRLAPKAQSMTSFLDMFRKERNGSLRRVIFSEICRTFLGDPNNETFSAVSAIINLLTAEDEVLKDLFSLQSMSSAYVSQYLKLIWKNIPKWEAKLSNGNGKLIECIDELAVKCLDDDFCLELLSHEMKKLPGPLSNFVYLCVLHAPSLENKLTRLRAVLGALAPFIEGQWSDRSTDRGHIFRVRQTFSIFVESLCAKCSDSKDKQSALRVLGETKTALAELTSLRNSLWPFYWLDAHIVFLNLQKDQMYEAILASLYVSYIERYQTVCPHALFAFLSHVVPMASRNKLAHELVQVTDVPLCLMLAAKIAETTVKSDEDLKLTDKIIDTLSSSDHPDVLAAASGYFLELESSLII